MSETPPFWAAVSLIMLAGCADKGAIPGEGPPLAMKTAPNDEHGQEVEGRSDCDVTIRFGSYATGIDRKAAATVERLIGADRSVTRVTRSPPEREGEYSLCVRTASRDHAVRLFETLEKSLRKPVNAPVFVNGPGRSFSAPPARRQ